MSGVVCFRCRGPAPCDCHTAKAVCILCKDVLHIPRSQLPEATDDEVITSICNYCGITQLGCALIATLDKFLADKPLTELETHYIEVYWQLKIE